MARALPGMALGAVAALLASVGHVAGGGVAAPVTVAILMLASGLVFAAATGATGPQFLRRGYNYDLGEDASGETDAGHVFTAYAADLATQFVPVQQALSDIDLLNQWTKPIGSAVFALPPGAPEGGWVGQTLLG